VAAEQRGAELRQRLERDSEDARVRIFAGAARKVLDRARQLLGKGFPCSQCQAPQVVSDHFFRSRHVTCTHCGRINTFIPSAKVMAVEYFCCHYLAEESALASRRAWQEAERRMHADHENLALMRATELALESHLRTYLDARIAIVPDYRDDFSKDLRGRMACFYDQISRTPGWVPRPDQP
jgi:transcription elongation factor Elf1